MLTYFIINDIIIKIYLQTAGTEQEVRGVVVNGKRVMTNDPDAHTPMENADRVVDQRKRLEDDFNSRS